MVIRFKELCFLPFTLRYMRYTYQSDRNRYRHREVSKVKNMKRQFIYVLRLKPALLNEKNWTVKEDAIVEKHFTNLQGLLEEGKLILAGKTEGLDEKTFGIVIIETDSEEEAKLIMKSDPAVEEGIMTAELFPYRVALIKKSL